MNETDSTTLNAQLDPSRVGYGAISTGGSFGPVVYVSNANDAGPGSLREAVAGNTPKWVLITQNLVIRPLTPIHVGSNTTIDARYGALELIGNGFMLWNVQNIIFSNLKITKSVVDGIQMAYAIDKIWIDRCTIQGSMDGNIDLTHTGIGPTRVTVSRCALIDNHKCCLFGLAANKGNIETGIRATFFRTHFRNEQRNPKILQGVAQITNCLIEYDLYGIGAFDGAHVLVDRCVVAARGANKAASLTAGYNGSGDATGYNLKSGCLKAHANLMLNGAIITENNPALVERLKFPVLSGVQSATPQLRLDVKAGAGIRSPIA